MQILTEDESSSNLWALEGKCQCFLIFYYVNKSTKSKTDSEFSHAFFGEIPWNLADWYNVVDVLL